MWRLVDVGQAPVQVGQRRVALAEERRAAGRARRPTSSAGRTPSPWVRRLASSSMRTVSRTQPIALEQRTRRWRGRRAGTRWPPGRAHAARRSRRGPKRFRRSSSKIRGALDDDGRRWRTGPSAGTASCGSVGGRHRLTCLEVRELGARASTGAGSPLRGRRAVARTAVQRARRRRDHDEPSTVHVHGGSPVGRRLCDIASDYVNE